MRTKLNVKVGDEVTIVARSGLTIVNVENVTPSGMIDAGGKRWNADGSTRERRRFYDVRLEVTTATHRDDIMRTSLAWRCVKAFDAIGVLHSSDVARMTANDICEATALIEKLAAVLAKRKQ